LIKHIHALKLDDIAQAAEAKQREYEKINNLMQLSSIQAQAISSKPVHQIL
jgi:hypothetical protein